MRKGMLGRAEGEKVGCDVAENALHFVLRVCFDWNGTL